MPRTVKIVHIKPGNLQEHGFFCYKSKRDSPGHRQKTTWVSEGFSHGLTIKILCENGRQLGFIEYVPGEFTWRAVRAPDYLVIHCLWVIGSGKGNGYGSRLISESVKDARRSGKSGVAMVTSSKTWLAGSPLLLANGFEVVDRAPPCFKLLVKRFGDVRPPSFPSNWVQRQAAFGPGLTIVRSSQCPYIEATVQMALQTAKERGLNPRVVELTSSRQARAISPTAYGVFAIVYDGELLTYHPLGKKNLVQLLDEHEHKAAAYR